MTAALLVCLVYYLLLDPVSFPKELTIFEIFDQFLITKYTYQELLKMNLSMEEDPDVEM